MELEAAHAVVAISARDLVDGVLPVRVDRAERDQDVGVRSGDLGDLLVAHGGAARLRLASTVKTTAAMLRSR